MQWTQDQLRVIEARDKNLLVAAAAGSGKTTVLVERVLGLVSEGVNIDEMLIVTFTRAAAGDMREKFRKRFSEIAADGDARAREQLERLENASISTIHSFLTDVLRANFEAAGIDPMFRILDDVEDAQLTERALDEVIEDAYAAGGEAMDALDFARGPEQVRALVSEAHAFLQERPDPEKWFQNALSLMEGDGDIWARTLADEAKTKISEAIALTGYAKKLSEDPEGPLKYAPALAADQQALEGLLSLGYDQLREALSGFKQITPRSGRRAKGDEPSEREQALLEEMTAVRKKAKTSVESAIKLLSLEREASLEDIRDNIPVIRKLYEIAIDLRERLTRRKQEKSALTFNDLERYALIALRDERVAGRVKEKYKYVFVDEYQDTSDVQEAIISLISGPNNRFMVGDVKQSIYRFRQAEPKLFMEKFESYKTGKNDELIVLKQNFRSRGAIIDFVNHVFSRVMRGGASEIVYDDDQKLHAGREFTGEDAPVELHIVDKAAEPEESDAAASDETTMLNDAEREGIVIARRIRELKAEDPSLTYRDICVITRVRVNALTCLASVLAAEGIPAYADASESYFDALEVMELMAVLRLIVNRRHDVDLISALRSPIVGLTTTQLAEIRAKSKGNSFYSAVLDRAGDTEAIARFLKNLDDWRALSRSMPVSRLIRHIATATGFYAYVGALPGGAQRQANIDAFTNRAVNYERDIGGSLSEFLDYAARLNAKGDGESAHILSENDDVVRLMTAHKSKGLEFKVVFASLLGRRYRVSRSWDNLTSHRDLGVSLMRMDERLQTRRETIAYRAIRQKELTEDRAEELRILYVTLTRAQSRLILTGSVRSYSAARTSWRIAVKQHTLYAGALDIIGAAVMDLPEGMRVRTRVYPAASLSVPETVNDEKRRKALKIIDDAANGKGCVPAIHNAILWRYPHAQNAQAPLKLTASGLSRELIGAFEIPDIAERPAFMNAGGLTAAERGTAIHAFLRAVDYAPLRALAGDELKMELGRQKRSMLERGILSPVQGQAVVLGAIANFFASPIGSRLMRAPEMHREWRFNLKMPASRAVPGAPDTADVIVQGSIDLCFRERDGWVLLDYKTDRSGDIEALRARYAPQLRLYGQALQDITGLPVKQTLICLIAQGEVIPLAEAAANA